MPTINKLIIVLLFLAKGIAELWNGWRFLQDPREHCSFDYETRKIRCKRVGFPMMAQSCQCSSCTMPNSFSSAHSTPCHGSEIGFSSCDSSSAQFATFDTNSNNHFGDGCSSTASCSEANSASASSVGGEPTSYREEEAVQGVEQEENSAGQQQQRQNEQQQQGQFPALQIEPQGHFPTALPTEPQGHFPTALSTEPQGQFPALPIEPQGQFPALPIEPQGNFPTALPIEPQGQFMPQEIPSTPQQQSFAVENANNGLAAPSFVCQSNEDDKAPYCCNGELKRVMREAYASAGVNCPRKDHPEAGCFHCCNIQRLANIIQHHCECRFGVTFEVIVGLRDFSLHSHYYDNLLCKISEGESQIVAFASAQGVCLPDGRPANSNNGTIPPMCGQGATSNGEMCEEKQQQLRDGEKCAGAEEKRTVPEAAEEYQLTEGTGRSETNADEQ
ncbi:hypothetical protein niasHT_029972 [Heterodera trifolii]|uniref:Ground-like domain-containing protein n=1 Tax=Heterodera trifolii TaxID=157864 RepID=A0ABD2JJF1_9BILA